MEFYIIDKKWDMTRKGEKASDHNWKKPFRLFCSAKIWLFL